MTEHPGTEQPSNSATEGVPHNLLRRIGSVVRDVSVTLLFVAGLTLLGSQTLITGWWDNGTQDLAPFFMVMLLHDILTAAGALSAVLLGVLAWRGGRPVLPLLGLAVAVTAGLHFDLRSGTALAVLWPTFAMDSLGRLATGIAGGMEVLTGLTLWHLTHRRSHHRHGVSHRPRGQASRCTLP